jgi:hypothetical protein
LKAETVEKIVGYTLLAIGLMIIMFFSIWMAFRMLNGEVTPPQLVQLPTTGEEGASIVAAFTPIANAFLIFFLFIVIEYGSAIITSRGVSLIKESKLKAYKETCLEHVKIENKASEKAQETQKEGEGSTPTETKSNSE